MDIIKIKMSDIGSFFVTVFWIFMVVLAFSVLEIQTQGRALWAETQVDDFLPQVIEPGSESSLNTSSFACFESPKVICSSSHELRRLSVLEVGFSVSVTN
ncbi:MAG: hypothetical protein K2P98_04205 [Neisseriaceae bacterium]|nr:hypothetical protein [Neisseriaceae bacterium]